MTNIRDGKRLETEIVLSAVSILNALIVSGTDSNMCTASEVSAITRVFY